MKTSKHISFDSDAPTSGMMSPSSSNSSLSSLDSGEHDTKPTLSLSLALEGVGVSVISDRPQEIIYLSLSQISVELNDSPSETDLEVKLGDIQVDNMFFKALFSNVVSRSTPKTEQEKVSYSFFSFFLSFFFSFRRSCQNPRLTIIFETSVSMLARQYFTSPP